MSAIMKLLSLLAAFAVPAVAAVDWPELRGSVAALVGLEGDGIQPGYCDGAPGNPDTSDDDNWIDETPAYCCYK